MDKSITKTDIQTILSDKNIFHGVPDAVNESSRFVLDSLSIFWLSHRLDEGWGIQLSLDEWKWDEVYSIEKLYEIALHYQVSYE